MTDYKKLCAELLSALESWSPGGGGPLESQEAEKEARLIERARAALADGPTAVTGHPSDEEWDALVERVWDKYQTVDYQGERFMYDGDFGSALDLVRKELFRWGHQPAPPAEGEVGELTGQLIEAANGAAAMGWDQHAQRILRAAEMLQRQVPVPVSERLPGPSDCAPWPKDSDASAWCWVGTDQDDGWNWEQRSAGCLAMFPDDFTHWLPAHALPMPEVGE